MRDLPSVIILAVLVTIIHGPTVTHSFVNYDDQQYVYDNENVKCGLTWSSVHWAFTTGYFANWHPITWLSLQLDHQFHGLNAGGYHLTNVALHFGATVCLYLALRRMTDDGWSSLAAAALWAVHPVQAEAVAWVAERKGLLSTLFGMLAILLYARYAARPSFARYLAVMAAYLASLMSKQMLVTLPILLLLLDHWPLRRVAEILNEGEPAADDARFPRRSLALLIVEKAPLFALALLFSLIAYRAQRSGGALPSIDDMPIDLRLGNMLTSYVSYLGDYAWPTALVFFHPHPGPKLEFTTAAWSAALLCGVGLLVLFNARRAPYLVVGWLWYLISLLPVIGLVQIAGHARADRYVCVPSLGLVLMLVWSLARRWAHQPRWRFVIAPAAAICFIALLVLSWRQTRTWQNSFTLYEHALAVQPDNSRAMHNLGVAYLNERKDPQTAKRMLRECLRMEPRFSMARGNLADIFTKEGRTEEAIEQFELVIKQETAATAAYKESCRKLGVLLAENGRPREALVYLKIHAFLEPKKAQARHNHGLVLLQLGQTNASLSEFLAAIEVDPDYVLSHEALASVYEALGRPDRAQHHRQRVAELGDPSLAKDPYSARAYNEFGMMLAGHGEFAAAAEQFTKALAKKPDYGYAANNLAAVLLRMGRPAEAVARYRQALELMPESAEVACGLAWILATHAEPAVRDPKMALELARRACEKAKTKEPAFNDTLAAALAANGDFAAAVVAAQAALENARQRGDSDLAEAIAERLSFYNQGAPFVAEPTQAP